MLFPMSLAKAASLLYILTSSDFAISLQEGVSWKELLPVSREIATATSSFPEFLTAFRLINPTGIFGTCSPG
jgi:hypothetical protein